MKRLVMLAIVAGGLLAGSAAFAQCSSCTTGSVSQNLNLTVPNVNMLVIDNAANFPANWNLNFKNIAGVSHCYAIPNQITTHTELMTFIKSAMTTGNGGLVETPSFPAVFWNSTQTKVLHWQDVVTNKGLPSSSPYLNYASYPAKGNVVCNESFVVEKYSNCPTGAKFYLQLQPGTYTDTSGGTTTTVTSPSSGFGAFLATDSMSLNGSPVGSQTNTGWVTTAGSTQYNLAKISSSGTGYFYDDAVNEWLWLQSAQPGTYVLQTTYTLAAL